MKKPNENTFSILSITPAEEKAILLSFERYVATYQTDKKDDNLSIRHLPIIPKNQNIQSWIA